MNITIQINTDGEAFEDSGELLEVLEQIMTDALTKKEIFDSLGNRCGTVTIEESE